MGGGQYRPAALGAPTTRAFSRAYGGGHPYAECQDHGSGGERGYDAGKHVKGRKRHIVVDTVGSVSAVIVHAASTQDYQGVKEVLRHVVDKVGALHKIWAHGIYALGGLVEWVREMLTLILEIVDRPEN